MQEEKFEEFLRRFYEKQLLIAAREGLGMIEIDFSILDVMYPDLADQLLAKPEDTLEQIRDAILNIELPGKGEIEPRFKNLPKSSDIRIRNIRSEHIGKMITVEGIVRRASEVRPEIKEAIFQCPDCAAKIPVEQKSRMLTTPSFCECGRKGKFEMIDKTLFDARRIMIEEPFETATGERPGDISLYLKDDLTTPEMQKKCDPGNRLRVTIIVKELEKMTKGKAKTQLDRYGIVNHIENADIEWEEVKISKEDEDEIKTLAASPEVYDKFISSIASSIYGLNEIKEAIVLQLFSGVPQMMPDGNRIRGDIHILLLGDPSVAKSQLLKLTSKIIPRGKYVSGKGTTAAGLCVTPDTIVMKEDGSFDQIGNIVEKELSRGKIPYKDGIVVSKNPTPMKILSFDTKNFKIKPLNITQYWRIKSPEKLIKIKTRLGKEIKVTLDNPIPLFRNNRVIWKKAKEIEKGDFIATPRIINYQSNDEVSIFKFLDKNSRLVNSNSIINIILAMIQKKTTIRNLSRKTGLDENKLYHSWRAGGHAPKLSELITIGHEIDLDIEAHLPDKLTLFQQMGHKISLPRNLNQDIMYLFGLVAGDGSISKSKYGGLAIRFCSDDKELLNYFEDISSSQFSISPKYYKHPERIPYYRFHSKIIGNIMSKLGIPNGKKSRNLKITNELSNLPNNLISSYLSGLFDTDGSVVMRKTQGSSYIDLTSISKDFLKGIQLLLLKFDILSRFRERQPTISTIRGRIVKSGKKYVLEIKGKNNILKFNKSIGFRLSRKSKKLDRLISTIKVDHTNIDFIPHISLLLKEARLKSGLSAKEIYGYKNYTYERGERRISRNMLQKIINKFDPKLKEIKILRNLSYSDIFWDEIAEISEIPKQGNYVYDLTIKDEHSFVANGLIVHNTATVLKDEELMGGWVLEAGAMVLCNKGTISIDEFDKMGREDQIAMHEALEQQSYHPDTEVILSDGSKYQIGNLVDNLILSNKNKILKANDCEILPIKNLEILTTDFNKIYSTEINRVSRHLAPKNFIKITYSNGRSIIVTPEHPVFVLRSGIETLRADKINKGMLVPTPTVIPIKSENVKLQIVKSLSKEKAIKLPKMLNNDFGRVLGYYISEGHSFIGKRSKEIGFTNSDKYLLNDMSSRMFKLFGMKPYIQQRHPNVQILRYCSYHLYRFFEKNFPEILEKAGEKDIPHLLLKSNDSIIKEFLSGAFLGDGFVDSNRFGYCTTSEKLAKGYQDLLLISGIYSYITYDRTQKSYKVVISGTRDMEKFVKNISDKHDKRLTRMRSLVSRSRKINRKKGELPAFFSFQIKQLLSELKLDDGYFNAILCNNYNLTVSTAKKYIKVIKNKLDNIDGKINSVHDPHFIRKLCRISQYDLQKRFGINHATVSYMERTKSHKRKEELLSYVRKLYFEKRSKIKIELRKLNSLINSNIRWIRVKNVEIIKNKNIKYVYDVTVEPTRSFISEGLILHNTVSIAKASIVATLPAEVSVLAGANPKFSRFDAYRPIAEQINIPDTLLSRFDLKFILRDVPDKDQDERLSAHILESRLDPKIVEPILSKHFIRKYLAYARKNCSPELTREAAESLKKFYVDMRGLYTGTDTVAITLRQNEALIRLSQASAKIRLDDKVRKEDADRAIRIMKKSLQELAYDVETGRMDIDRAEGGTSSSQRGKINTVLDIVQKLEKQFGKNVPRDEIVLTALDEGIKEIEAGNIIDRLKMEGLLYEPKIGFIQRTH